MSLFSKKKLTELKAKDTAQKKHTILIVDDEESNRKVMASVLRDFYHVLETEDGVAALELVKGMDNPEKIAMVISDQRMPNMTGVELFEQLSSIIPKTVRIIVTGFIDVESIIDSVNKAHIYKFILKPFERVDFLWTAKRAVETFEQQKEKDDHLASLEKRSQAHATEMEKKNQELDQAYKKLEEVSLTDQLTGMKNRHFLMQFLNADVDQTNRTFRDWSKDPSQTQPENVSLVFYVIDIDDFKTVNEQYGHSGGDKLLENVKPLLEDVFRSSDFLIRFSGEQFLVVARNANYSDGASISERLKVVFSNNQFDLGEGNSVKKTVSIGYATYPFIANQPDAVGWEQVINIADVALRAAKNSGRNSWIGLASGSDDGSDAIAALINSTPGQLVDDGIIKATSSIDGEINWNK
jgi:diguanylate cyclase (GGDEF)-like protein